MTDRAMSGMNKPRFCRTPEESFQAGWEDGANLPPLTPAQVTYLAALLGPYIRASLDAEIAKELARENPARR